MCIQVEEVIKTLVWNSPTDDEDDDDDEQTPST